MKTVVVLILFIGMFFIVQGVYEQKLKESIENKKVEYKFIPRTYYEEQLESSELTSKVGKLYESNPWGDRVLGDGSVQKIARI